MKPHVSVVFAALFFLALSACSQSSVPSAVSSQSCDGFEPPVASLHGVYDIPSNASGPSAACTIDEALASGDEVVGRNDLPFFWQSLDALSEPASMPLAMASSPPNEPPQFKKFVPPGAPRASVSNGVLPSLIVAAYRQTNGVVDTFQGDADSSSVLNEMLDQWHQTGAGPDADATIVQQTIQPFRFDPKVWMNLGNYNGEVAIDASGRVSGRASAAYRVFRLNTRDPKYDYFLITLDGLNKVQGFNDCKYDFPRFYCEWLNRGLRLSVRLARSTDPSTGIGNITEAEPKNAITSGKYEISEGYDLKGEISCEVGDSAGVSSQVRPSPFTERLQPQAAKCGVNGGATYSSKVTQTWDVQSRTIHNYTAPSGTTGDWDMTFSGWSDNCKGGPFPEDLKTTGDFGAAEIIRVPRDVIYTSSAPRLMLVATFSGRTIGWEYLLRCDGYEYQSSWALFPTFELPTFFVNATKGLAVSAGSSGQFVITSKIPDADIGLTANLVLIKNGEKLDPKDVGLKITADDRTAYAILSNRPDIMPRVQTWTVTASATAPKTTYKLYVDTVPGGETDNVRLGPIEVPLTIN